MLISVFGSSVFGVEANRITIEVNICPGIGYHLVGLPDNAIKESNYRIAAALTNIGYKLPGKKITIIWLRLICVRKARHMTCH